MRGRDASERRSGIGKDNRQSVMAFQLVVLVTLRKASE